MLVGLTGSDRHEAATLKGDNNTLHFSTKKGFIETLSID